jgi:hypothetical protein
MGVSIDEFLTMLGGLPEVEQRDGGDWTSLRVGGKGFGYLWERTRTVGLKATILEQLSLVAERPEVFEKQFTDGRFGWVVVHLDKIEPDELVELLTEAWCLTAPRHLAEAHETTWAGRLEPGPAAAPSGA